MSKFDSREGGTTGHPLSAKEQLENLLNALLDDEDGKRCRITKRERSWLLEIRNAINESRMTEPDAKDILKQHEGRFLTIIGRGITDKDIDNTRRRIKKIVDDHESRLDWEAGAPEWEKKTKKKTPSKSNYLM